ncbi:MULTISPECIES: hypothetical protein [Streptomyces]|uniref:hypothetical protein n=1 Tax=Streptomyces TaxID=1883 RepID=UPI0029BBD503|nr:hypothetical protein [Streptomyces stelliscabiei]MDX2520569.1 hypothetical protein [Streptomyces stelliscabiei]MDX2552666.1 hypothetical protein [Streptomyces stelliscabiei]MDX2661350.1 hypothetical protein [Streptomyces stelliscabiei]MDX2788831.1 hypothetical protein [Streptomyces stelliscabiei]
MGRLSDFARSLRPGNDHQLADEQYAGRESAAEAASRKRREGHRARVIRDGDGAGTKIPRSLRRKAF